jgi:AcrR family transcriptional regulator
VAFRDLSPESARGRQPEARRNDKAVLEAARDVFSEHGAGAPISAVAERAGVGMGTLYRRYGSKAELLQRLCLLAMEQALEAAGAALQAPDPWAGLAAFVTDSVEMRSGALAALAGQVEVTPQMQATARRGITAVARIVARAQRDGSLRADVTPLDVSYLIEAFSRRAPASAVAAEDRNVRDRLLAIALDGLRAGGGAPLPGRPPSEAGYAGRWDRDKAPG